MYYDHMYIGIKKKSKKNVNITDLKKETNESMKSSILFNENIFINSKNVIKEKNLNININFCYKLVKNIIESD